MDASTVLSCGFDILKTYSGEFELIVVEYPADPMIVVLGVIACFQQQRLSPGWPKNSCAIEKENVTVKTTSVNGNVVLIDAEVNGKLVQLECVLSVAHCKIPKQGSYFFVRVPAGKGVYTDCQNVDLYEPSLPTRPGTEIGEYCLLGE
jgi:hypothetical protein